MQKTIYFNSRDFLRTHGLEDFGLFDDNNFGDFMNRYPGAQLVTSHVCGKDHSRIYHIEPQGVTLCYKDIGEGRVVSIDLYGKRERLGVIERKIFKAAGKLNIERSRSAEVTT